MNRNVSDLRLSSLIIDWYSEFKRDLPWRHTTDPYKIWISEVILQQTRVVQGLDYYNRFMERFPTVKNLADAEENDVLLLWQGLGYYSRARNLHKGSKQVMDIYKGVMPSCYKDLLTLKGVGEYTAAAISSFAYNEPKAVVDGNVYRVLSRVFAIDTPINSTSGKKIFAELAQQLLDAKRPGIHNQALMELGALQCVPVSPVCDACPLQMMCQAYALKLVADFPVKDAKIKVKNRYFNYIDIQVEGKRYIVKRENNDIWKNLYELPLIESDSQLSADELINLPQFNELNANLTDIQLTKIKSVKHILSHQTIHATFYRLVCKSGFVEYKTYVCVSDEELLNYPFSKLVNSYLY